MIKDEENMPFYKVDMTVGTGNSGIKVYRASHLQGSIPIVTLFMEKMDRGNIGDVVRNQSTK